MLTLLLISLATASMTLTLSKSKLFAPVRKRVFGRGWFGTMVRCHYCLSHWVALYWLVFAGEAHDWTSLILHWFAIVAMAAFFMGLILLVVPMRGDVDAPTAEEENA